MTLVNQGLISAEVSGKTVTVSATSFTNNGTAHALDARSSRSATLQVRRTEQWRGCRQYRDDQWQYHPKEQRA